MRAKIEKWQLLVILKLCARMKRTDFKISVADLNEAELYVLKKLEKANAPYDGWWTDDEMNIFVEYDPDYNQYDVYYGNGWI